MAPCLRELRTQAPYADLIVIANGEADWGAVRQSAERYGAEVVLEPKPGYSSARNAALRAAAKYRYLIFFDDDQVPDPGWFRSLVCPAETFGARVVFGPVIVDLPSRAWARPYALRTTRIAGDGWHTGDCYSGNTLLDVAFFNHVGLRFSPKHDAYGGEDTWFFRAARDAGATFYFSASAVARERVDPSRVTAAGRFRGGQVSGRRRHALEGAAGAVILRRVARAAVGVLRVMAGGMAGSRPLVGQGLYDIGVVVGFAMALAHARFRSEDG